MHIVQAGVEAWLDATVYEVFVLPAVHFNQTILHLNLSLTGDFHSQANYNYDNITFHLHSVNLFFNLGNQNTSHTTFLNYFDLLPSRAESTSLVSAVTGHLPLNDYKMRIEVTAGNSSVTTSDIIIHVVDPLPSLPVPGNIDNNLYML